MAQPGTLAEWLDHQEQLHPSEIELGLERVRRVAEHMQLLQSPPRTIIVGGTNGKGSTTTLLALIYREAGYRVGAYTSPHLFRYNERIAIDGQHATDAMLCRAFAAVELARAGQVLTYFEFGTLAALWLFREAEVQVQVLEVGLGGRLDAVNVLSADAAIVTNIGLDHLDWLGPDRDAIGFEKAGIFRAGHPAIIADPMPPDGLLDAARAIGADVQRFDQQDFQLILQAEGWHWRSRQQGDSPQLPYPALHGAHQLHNAAGALAVVQSMQAQLPLPWSAVQRALPLLCLPGRMERRRRFLLDVAHNAEAAVALAELMRSQFPQQRAIWVAGLLADKPVETIATALAEVVSQAITCDLPGSRGLSADALATRLATTGMAARAAGTPAAALAMAIEQSAADQPILISGSFLTVAAIAPLIAND